MKSAKSPYVRLRHILENIEGIQSITVGISPAEVIENYGLIRAVERGIQIISEAAKELPQELRDQEPDIPWKDIIGIGNFMRHEYYRIREDILIDILVVDLPLLKPAILRMLSTEAP